MPMTGARDRVLPPSESASSSRVAALGGRDRPRYRDGLRSIDRWILWACCWPHVFIGGFLRWIGRAESFPLGSVMVLCLGCIIWLYISFLWVVTLFPLARWYERLVIPTTHPAVRASRLVLCRTLYFFGAVGYVVGVCAISRQVAFPGKDLFRQLYIATMALSFVDWLVVERFGWWRPRPPS